MIGRNELVGIAEKLLELMRVKDQPINFSEPERTLRT